MTPRVGQQEDVVTLLGIFDRDTSHLEFGRIVTGALAFMNDRLRVDRASVALLREQEGGFLIFGRTMKIAGLNSGQLVAHGSSTLTETVRECRSYYRENIRDWPKPNPADRALLDAGIQCTFSAPMVVAGRCIGTLNAGSREVDGLPEAHRTVIELVAPRLAQAIQNGLFVEALAESEARFRALFDTVSDGILVAETDTKKFVMVNRAMCALLGRDEKEILSLSVPDIHPQEDLPRVVALFEAQVRGEQALSPDIPLLRKDGTVTLADVAASFVTLGGKKVLAGSFRDASERRRKEQDVLQSQKLESIRTLAGGIAHDFNNLLTGILGNVSLARLELTEDHPAREPLSGAEQAAVRATGLTRQLVTFAKGGTPVRTATNLSQTVRDAAELATAGSSVRCEVAIAEPPWTVDADAGQIAQVVQNLVMNAVQSMPNGGVVNVRVDNELEHRHVRGPEPRDCVRVTVEDHGDGIPREHLDKIFIPFFTTRDKGTGLGLAVVYSIVANHDGHLDVQSEPGRGSVFRFWLPALRTASDASAPGEVCLATGHGRILVMDDEPLVRTLSKSIGCGSIRTVLIEPNRRGVV
ncbi:MAG: PAS domain S-box protein [Deltaproteobacteria bacterium]|nr:PAS domain S-box protein [Deltaproteobacteria bacterium]